MSRVRTKEGVPGTSDFAQNPKGATRLVVDVVAGNLYALKSDNTVAQVGGGVGTAAWGGITGTLSAQSDLQSALNGKQVAGSYATAAQGSIADSALQPSGYGGGLTGLSKAQVGLSNVDNTSDALKPVSTAMQTALDAKQSTSAKGSPNGYAGLDAGGLVPSEQLPSGSASWGGITGVLSAQTDLQSALDGKQVAGTYASGTGSASGVNTGDQIISDSTISTTDITTNNVSITKHGFAPKAPNSTSVFLRGDATWATPPGGAASINTLRTTSDQTINSGAGVFVDITGLTFPVVSGTDYAFEFYITFRSAATTTGWRAGVNCPAGTLDFWAGSDVIANGAAGVATHTERHNTVRDDMTLLTATITQNVDLNVRIKGRYLCTANGTFAARFANELASNTQIVVQKGSWGTWF